MRKQKQKPKEKGKKKIIKTIVNIITTIILLICLYFAYQFYQKNNFNDFIRSESNLYTSEFSRDNKEKYSNKRSYKITSPDYNDAMFFKTIKVEKNKPYKVTCMVKTNNVESKEQISGIGAQISIQDSTERSVAISGTQDWQKIELIFNSKDRDTVDIGFRLGGYLGQVKGEAWFSDFTIEQGVSEQSTEWNFACFILKQTDVVINEQNIKLDVTPTDITDIRDTMERFKNSVPELSEGKMTAKYDIYEIETPLTKLSYDKQYGYYASPEDVENQIKDYLKNSNYDHIFIVLRLGNEEHKEDIEINDWIGLGSMDYYGVGFSNIRLPNDSRSYIYKYNPRINTFPEEVFLHEFLHSLERTSKEYGYEVPDLHDYEKYGYENQRLVGQKIWYKDYMNKNINTETGKIGLPNEVYELKPAKESNFETSYKIEEFKEPENLIEEINQIFEQMCKNVKLIFNNEEIENNY